MSLAGYIKRILGMSPDEEEFFADDRSDEIPMPDTSETQHNISADADAVSQSAPTSDGTEQSDLQFLTSELLDEVIGMFNAIQPEFVSKCLDTEKQREMLVESMSVKLRERVTRLADATRREVTSEAEAERRALAENIARLKSQNAALEERKGAFENEQLSAKRQKRALSDRVHDLESKITEMEAEREQLQLENRSMLNKMRVMSVTAGGELTDESLIEKVDQLSTANSGLETEVGNLSRQLDEAQASIESLNEENNQLRAEAENKVMQLHDAEQQARRLTEQLRDSEEALGNAKFQNDNDAGEIESLHDRIDGLMRQLEKYERMEADYAARDREMEEISGKLTQLNDANLQIEALKTENNNLRDTIERNLHDHAAIVDSLRREIARMSENELPVSSGNQPEAGDNEQPASSPLRKRRGRHRKNPEPETPAPAPSRPKLSAIDELIDSNEWFVAPELTSKNVSAVNDSDSDFGYREPEKKHSRPDDLNQLTLF